MKLLDRFAPTKKDRSIAQKNDILVLSCFSKYGGDEYAQNWNSKLAQICIENMMTNAAKIHRSDVGMDSVLPMLAVPPSSVSFVTVLVKLLTPGVKHAAWLL